MNVTTFAPHLRVETPDWLFWIWNINAPITLAVNWFAMATMRFKTPKELKHYRWMLINMQFWIFACDMCLNFSMRPVILYPLSGFYSDGLISRLFQNSNAGRFAFCGLWIVNSCGAAITCCFIYRWRILLPQCRFVKTGRRLFLSVVSFHFLFSSPTVLFMMFAQPNESQLRSYLQTIEMEWVLSHVTSYALFVPSTLTFCFVFSIFIPFFIYALTSLYSVRQAMRILKTKMYTMNDELQTQNTRLTRILSVQVIVPLLVYLIPITLVATCIYLKSQYTQNAFHVMTVVFGMHTHMNVILLFSLHTCYRRTIVGWWRGAMTSRGSSVAPLKSPSSSVIETTNSEEERKTPIGPEVYI